MWKELIVLKAAKIRRSSLRLTTTKLLGLEDLIKMLNAVTVAADRVVYIVNTTLLFIETYYLS